MPIASETRREAAILDGFASCMGHEYRRKILFLLYLSEDGAGLVVPDDLLDEGVDRDRFLIELAHHHLPKLEELGFVYWDRESGIVTEGDEFERLEPLLEVLTEHYDHIVPHFEGSTRA